MALVQYLSLCLRLLLDLSVSHSVLTDGCHTCTHDSKSIISTLAQLGAL